jgi:hypothetical protein
MRERQLCALGVGALALVCCGGEASSGSADASTEDVLDAPTLQFDASDADVDATGDDHSNASDADAVPLDGVSGGDDSSASDADASPLDCVSGDGGSLFDAASRFRGSCSGGCPAGTICAVEIGGVAGGGGEYCAPIPDPCRSTPTCACLGSCACGTSFGRPQTCVDARDQDGGQTIQCDNGIR